MEQKPVAPETCYYSLLVNRSGIMKNALLLFAVAIFIGVGHPAYASDAILSESLLGKWSCSAGTVSDGMEIKMEFEQDYIGNGTFDARGDLTFTALEEGVILEYIVVGAGEWEISDNFLIETITDVEITSVNPLFDELFDLEEMFPTGISDASKIITLSEDSLVTVAESDGTEISCSRSR